MGERICMFFVCIREMNTKKKMRKRKERRGERGGEEKICWNFYRISNSGYHWEQTWISFGWHIALSTLWIRRGHRAFPNNRKRLWLMLLWPKLWGLPSVPCEISLGPTQALVLTHLHSYPSQYVFSHVPHLSEQKGKDEVGPWVLNKAL